MFSSSESPRSESSLLPSTSSLLRSNSGPNPSGVPPDVPVRESVLGSSSSSSSPSSIARREIAFAQVVGHGDGDRVREARHWQRHADARNERDSAHEQEPLVELLPDGLDQRNQNQCRNGVRHKRCKHHAQHAEDGQYRDRRVRVDSVGEGGGDGVEQTGRADGLAERDAAHREQDDRPGVVVDVRGGEQACSVESDDRHDRDDAGRPESRLELRLETPQHNGEHGHEADVVLFEGEGGAYRLDRLDFHGVNFERENHLQPHQEKPNQTQRDRKREPVTPGRVWLECLDGDDILRRRDRRTHAAHVGHERYAQHESLREARLGGNALEQRADQRRGREREAADQQHDRGVPHRAEDVAGRVRGAHHLARVGVLEHVARDHEERHEQRRGKQRDGLCGPQNRAYGHHGETVALRAVVERLDAEQDAAHENRQRDFERCPAKQKLRHAQPEGQPRDLCAVHLDLEHALELCLVARQHARALGIVFVLLDTDHLFPHSAALENDVFAQMAAQKRPRSLDRVLRHASIHLHQLVEIVVDLDERGRTEHLGPGAERLDKALADVLLQHLVELLAHFAEADLVELDERLELRQLNERLHNALFVAHLMLEREVQLAVAQQRRERRRALEVVLVVVARVALDVLAEPVQSVVGLDPLQIVLRLLKRSILLSSFSRAVSNTLVGETLSRSIFARSNVSCSEIDSSSRVSVVASSFLRLNEPILSMSDTFHLAAPESSSPARLDRTSLSDVCDVASFEEAVLELSFSSTSSCSS
ncbi:hypothetical protein OGATHE_006601 [Ogataea polymorpha]|uniref:Uncharacterized protein n=1 Tax=Ogataea polymorpha TaxID=460523 RepID=A0A9P8NS44_9ASCO|nr:hypothetical protein OGATHE_006601 [Ogataea polymorpha]